MHGKTGAIVRRAVELAALHVEKALLGASIIAFAVLSCRAVQRGGFEGTAEDFLRCAVTAHENVQGTPPPKFRVPRYCEMIERGPYPVSELDYAVATAWRPPLWQPGKRATPEVLPARDLIASAGHGLMAISAADDASTGGLQTVGGQRWVVVTGVIEDSKQQQAFQEAFGESLAGNPQADRPDYVYFRVERAEVQPGQESRTLAWMRQNVRAMYEFHERWFGTSQEIVDARYIPPARSGISLVFPLGPLVDREWSLDVAHPRIPLAASAEISQRRRHAAIGQSVVREAAPDRLLVRYFDYGVEPGKRYQYRLKLVLANPNYGLRTHDLYDEETAGRRYLESGWSEPTPTIRVPPDTHVLAGIAAAHPRHPTATVMLVRLDADKGKYNCREVQAGRGRWLGAGGMLLDVRGGETMPGRSRLAAPASVLLLDADGNLTIGDELDDRPEYKDRKSILEQSQPKPPGLIAAAASR